MCVFSIRSGTQDPDEPFFPGAGSMIQSPSPVAAVHRGWPQCLPQCRMRGTFGSTRTRIGGDPDASKHVRPSARRWRPTRAGAVGTRDSRLEPIPGDRRGRTAPRTHPRVFVGTGSSLHRSARQRRRRFLQTHPTVEGGLAVLLGIRRPGLVPRHRDDWSGPRLRSGHTDRRCAKASWLCSSTASTWSSSQLTSKTSRSW